MLNQQLQIISNIRDMFFKGGYPIGTVRNGYKKIADNGKGDWVKYEEKQEEVITPPVQQTTTQTIQNVAKELPNLTQGATEPTAKDFREMSRKYEAEGEKYTNYYHHYLLSGDAIKAEAMRIKANEAFRNVEKAKTMWSAALKKEKKD